MEAGDGNRKVLCPLREKAIKTPDAPAIALSDRTLVYAELDARVSAAARRLRDAGCEDGTRVALYLPLDERYVVLLLALFRIRAVACPISTRLPSQSACSLAERVACSIFISEDAGLTDAVSPEALDTGFSFSDSKELLWVKLDQPATIVFTSGSSGHPKAALHTFGNHYYSALGSGANITLSLGDRWLLSLPLYHVGGLSILFRCLMAGAAIAIPRPDAPLVHSIRELGATHISLVATQLRRLLEERANLDGVKTILLGGGPVPNALIDEAMSRSLPVHTSYGLTEMSSQVTTTPPGAFLSGLRTSGRVLPHREVVISGDGEILVRGDTLFAGYVRDDGLERPVDEAGWFHTGDLGDLDGEGYLRVRGRKDNLFISGGENIQPEEIEEYLGRLEGLERAVVVPIPDEDFGERPAAFVLPADGGVTSSGLAGKLERELPRFKIPVAFYEWPEGADPRKTKVDRTFFRDRARRRELGDET